MKVSTPLSQKDYGPRKVDTSLWWKLLRYTYPYKLELILLCVIAAATAMTEAAFPLLTRGVVDLVTTGGDLADLVPYGVGYVALMVTFSVLVWTFIRLAGGLRTHISHDIRRDGFANLQALSFSFYDRRSVGWLITRMTSDCERLSNIFAWGILDIVWGLTLMSTIAVVLISLDVTLALLTLSVIPVLALLSAFFQKKILRASRLVRKTNSLLTGSFSEGIMGLRTSKVLVREEENLREFRDLSGRMYDASVRNALYTALYIPLVLTLASVATALVLSEGGQRVVSGVGGLSVATLVTFLIYTRQFFEPVHQTAYWFAEFQMAQAAAERVVGLIEEVPEVRDTEAVAQRMRGVSHDPTPTATADGGRPDIAAIRFEEVSFAYGDGPEVLTEFDLDVARGETIALVGATGSGKTTVLNLLCRFYEPTRGRVLFDGVDYRERSLHWLQSNLGIVLQTPHLFRGTVAENIRYGRLEASDVEVFEAASLVGAQPFIDALEKGYDTEVGEGGNLLSTGEKQLISFARAILARPQLMIMDEATSSVDTETERNLQAAVRHVLEGRTSFVVAHRLSTIRGASRIVVIDRGRKIEEGTHGELLARRGAYHALYTEQSFEEAIRGGGQ